MKRSDWGVLSAFVSALALAPAAASGQTHPSIGAGITVPASDFADLYDNGYTVRGQVSLDLPVVEAHIQGGWSRFVGKQVTGGTDPETLDDANVYHAGAGARVGLGVLFVGANAVYFFGDLDEGFGFLPEAGVGVGPIEFVADYRADGDANWFGIRAALKF